VLIEIGSTPPPSSSAPGHPRSANGEVTLDLALGDAAEPQLKPTLVLEETGAMDPAGGTSGVAAEIADLLFKSCPSCQSSFGGEVEICPHDGTRLSEHSLFHRETLLFGPEGLTAAGLELKKYCPGCKRNFPLHLKVCAECGSTLMIPTLGGPAAASRSGPPQLGPVIADKYRLLEDIGAGGFGSVYLAKHESLGKRYAIKVLRSQLSDRMSFRNRFHEEALKLSRLEDENIVKVIDFGEWQEFQYMVTEYVEGKDLGSIIYQERSPPLRAARILRQVAGALSEAHAKKIVHLDLKPNNILVSQKRGKDLVKVIDFGIAEIYSETRARRQENVAGTCTYMAPEQWRRGSLDPRTDVYSFGVIFYEFLAGRPPFRHPRISDLEKAHCGTAPAPLRKLRPDLPAELERLGHKCLEKDPARRVQSAEELEAALDGYLRRVENRPKLRRALAAAAILLVAAGSAWGISEWVKDREPPRLNIRAEGNGLVEAPARGAGKLYQIREPKAVLVLEASDNREVNQIIVNSPELEWNQKAFNGSSARPEVTLRVGLTHLSAIALDRAGNPSVSIPLTLERLPAPRLTVEWEKLRPFSSQPKVELPILDQVGIKATVICRQGAERNFEAEVSERGVIAVPLKHGENTVELWTQDLLNGEKTLDPKNVRTVRYLEDRLSLKAGVVPGEGVVDLAPRGEWLTRNREIGVEVQVDDAAKRLEEGARLIYRRPPRTGTETLLWEKAEVARGRKIISVPLEEGPNELVIEPLSDVYGNRSAQQSLTVRLDRSGPRLEFPDDTIDDFGEALPVVRFRVEDDNPDENAGSYILRSVEDKEEVVVDRKAYEVKGTGDGAWEIRFTTRDALSEGSHSFRIVASDRTGNASGEGSGRFTVLADHGKPRIEVLAPTPGPRLVVKRGQEIRVQARVEDALPDDLSVKATIRVKAPRIDREKTIPLSRAAASGIWETAIAVGRDFEKPDTFDTERPEFRITVSATDRAGREETSTVALEFGWENRDKLLWPDGSVLVYHAACSFYNVGPFFMAMTEVTNRQYRAFLKDQGGKAPRSREWSDANRGQNWLDLPVRWVSWREACDYARWAKLQLPGKSQWMAAAYWDYDATRPRPYPWSGNWVEAGPEPVHCGKKLSPVKASADEKPYSAGRTPFGLCHMLGNVWELVRDEETGNPKRVGGAFYMNAEIFQAQEFKAEYLLGTSVSPEGEYADGFRCCLLPKGEIP